MLKEEEQEAERETERQGGGADDEGTDAGPPSLLHSAVAHPERAPLPASWDARLYAYYSMPFVRPQRIPTVVLQRAHSARGVQNGGSGVLCLFGFLATDSLEKKYLCSLSVVINGVAAAHYYAILKVRIKNFRTGCGSKESSR